MSTKPRRVLKGVLLTILLSTLVVQPIFWWCVRVPVPDVEVPDLGQPTIDGGIARVAGSSLERRDGYWFFVHRGDAVTVGAAHAVLGEFLIHRVESEMFGDFTARMPLPLRMALPGWLMWSYRQMPHALPPEQQQELWGFSASYADRYPLDPYRRGMYYHALHDITQELVGNPWVDPRVAGACTGFAASGAASVDGHLILGRNFDFEVFPLFDDEKVVHLFAREGAIPVLSVSWMAMSGVVTGLNAEGIWISLNAARTEGRNRAAAPVSLRLRTILESARDLDDVRRLVAEQDPLVADIFLVGDGKTGEAVVIERGKEAWAERPLVDGRIAASNHMTTELFSQDTEDSELRRYSTTLARGLRMQELVEAEPLSVPRAQAILRDRAGPGDIALESGSRNAIDALIATHSVLADATDRVMWVSTAPHTLGPYRAIDLLAELDAAGVDTAEYRKGVPIGARAWERTGVPISLVDGAEEATEPPPPPADLPADPYLTDGGWTRLQQLRGWYTDGEAYLGDDQWAHAEDIARRIEGLEPESTDAAWLRAEARRGLEDDAGATEAYTEFLQRFPARGPRTAAAEAWLTERGGLPDVRRPDES